jgi:TPR repeat protein
LIKVVDGLFLLAMTSMTVAAFIMIYEEGDGVETNHVEAYAWIGAALKVGVPNEAREVLIYRLGAISARLNTEELAQAQQLAGERSLSAPAAQQPVSGNASGDRTSRFNQ